MEVLFNIEYTERSFSVLRALKVMYGERSGKTCKDCNKHKPNSEYYIRKNGVCNSCKECERARRRAWVRVEKPKLREAVHGFICKHCNEDKPWSDSYERAKGRVAICKACEKTKAVKWKQENRSKVHISDATYRSKNKSKIAMSTIKYRAKRRAALTDPYLRSRLLTQFGIHAEYTKGPDAEPLMEMYRNLLKIRGFKTRKKRYLI